MTDIKYIKPIKRVEGTVSLPGSKSISNRALLLSALSTGTTELSNLLVAEDTDMMIGALRKLGVSVEQDGTDVKVVGCAGHFPNKVANLFLGNAGTAMRPLASVLAFSGGEYVLDGVQRMRERPMQYLVEALNSVGAHIVCMEKQGFPPLKIFPATKLLSDTINIKGNVSSQFVTGLLINGPLVAPHSGLYIHIEGELVSSPYVSLTCQMMGRFGVVTHTELDNYFVPQHPYISPIKFLVEADASSASYFLALGALVGPLTVEGIGRDSIQGDATFVEYLAKMGATVVRSNDHIKTAPPFNGHKLRGIDEDYRQIPDAAMTIAAIAPMCEGRTVLRGIGSWRVKETDRIEALATELSKTGAAVEYGEDWMAIEPPAKLQGGRFATYNDHRIAMCMSLIAAGGVPVEIENPSCVAKTFPDFFERLASVTEEDND
ncbi:MAG: 3-phosphoshikimate 1-carboxyvinyltransferase [Burkholderiales bacterium]|nr:3-phosphoshikimate 1-carboxyvinyltransferase [Burkholderiales bacterium]